MVGERIGLYNDFLTKIVHNILSIINIYRWEIISKLIRNNNYNTYVEVGVWKGENLLKIIKRCKGLIGVYGVDPYKETSYRKEEDLGIYNQEYFNKVYNKIIKKVNGKAIIIRNDSNVASKFFKDNSMDFVFIDSNHSYKTVKEDISLWYNKVRYDGIIAGHDYCVVHYGVILAVNEFFGVDNINRCSDGVWWVKKENI